MILQGSRLLSRPGMRHSGCRWPGRSCTPGGGYHACAPLPEFDGFHPVLGAWVVDGEPAGMGIRESNGPITDNASCFVPHVIDGEGRKS